MHAGHEVVLSDAECWVVGQVGLARHLQNLRAHDSYGFKGDGWGIHIEGAGAEYAYAVLSGRVWTPLVVDPTGQRRHSLPGDVENFEVRHTDRDGGGLILHPSDPPDRWFVLVTGRMPRYTVRGQMQASVGQKGEWWNDRKMRRNPCYLVPQDAGLLLPCADRRRRR